MRSGIENEHICVCVLKDWEKDVGGEDRNREREYMCLCSELLEEGRGRLKWE